MSLNPRSRYLVAACFGVCGVVLTTSPRAEAQCVDEALKEQLVGKRAYRGVVPRLFKKALRHELSPMGGWYAGDLADGAPIYGGAYTFHFTEDLGLEAAYHRTQRSFGFLEAIDERQGGLVDITDDSGAVNMFLGHLIWSMAYGKVRWFGGPIGRFDFYLSLGGGAVDEAGSRGVAGSFGFGLKLYMTQWLALRLDARDQIRPVRAPLGVERIVNDVTLMGGLSVFIPFSS